MVDRSQRRVRQSVDRGMPSPGLARRELVTFLRRFAVLCALIVSLLVVGTLGFVAFENASPWFGFVWTLDTIATVGAIPSPESTAGQVLKVILIVLGVGTLFYALVTVAEFFVGGHLSGLLDERKTQRMINSLTDHYLVCGFGRVGRQVGRDLRAAGASWVAIDDNRENRELAEAMNSTFIEGSPSDDEILRQAGIERARAVIACVDSDAENIFTTLTARQLCADITIVARASMEDSGRKLERAGADRVISPYKSSGSEMARLALQPQVSGVLEVAPEYRLEEIEVTTGCAGAGQAIEDIRGGSIIVALRKPDGSVQPQPPGDTILAAGEVLMAMGARPTMERLERLFAADTGARGEQQQDAARKPS